MALPVRLGVLRALMKEISTSEHVGKPLVVGGARELAAVLRRELGRDAKPGAVRPDDEPKGAAGLVYVLRRAPRGGDRRGPKPAPRARVPVRAGLPGPGADGGRVPLR